MLSRMTLLRRISYVHAPSLKPFIGLTMHEMLEERVKKNPDREMLVFVSDNERVTFAEYKKRVIDLAAGFLFKLGLRRGDRIAIIGANHVEWPLITGAARAIGVGVANLLIGHTSHTFQNVMAQVSCKALFITRSPDTLYPMVCEMIPELSESIPGDLNSKHGMLNLDDISISGCEEEVATAAKKVTIDDVSYFFTTSGTTGSPKLVPFTHFQTLNGSIFAPNQFDEKQINKLTFISNMAYIVTTHLSQVGSLLYGTTAVFPSPTYTFEKLVQAVEAERIFMVLPKPSGISSVTVDDGPDVWNTSGRPLPNTEIQIIDEKGCPVEVGENGEVWIRSPTAFRGYYGDIEKTKQTITEKGWIKTGDVGKLSENGYLTIVGRIKDIIIRRGDNIHPSEVESFVVTHPAVNIAQVIPIPDYRIGEDVCACVT
ncbi:medium-chain acyl-CoA ligase ACSF2, mitochondrial-like [Antedon mediterranea]|uniref:medium-chain acyl-CoA ligase ACSF2, mitochondrial-like n=1 Tax=Antedon mediterranea TaxID=105859 RepID=UPI003AF88FA2